MDWNLSPEELRVLGSLMEKEATTPDQYPLSINSLCNACNQKSSRDPVMELVEPDVREAVSSLTVRGLVKTASGYSGRVSKFAHRFGVEGSNLALSPEESAVLCVLFLRGPQTIGELRSRTQRIHEFESAADVELTLMGLAERGDGPLVRQLEREPGKRESRYMHCFGVPADTVVESPVAEAQPVMTPEESGTADPLEQRIAALERRMDEMMDKLDRLQGGTDMSGESSPQ